MYQKLDAVTLKNGEVCELGVVLGPDSSELATNLRRLLGHKGSIWRWQIEESLTQPATDAESRFFILSKFQTEHQSGMGASHGTGGQATSGTLLTPFANIMLAESHGVGIFGHVYTLPQERRKGAAEILQKSLFNDFKTRGGKALYLGTEFDSPPWHIYAKHGFASVEPRSDYMAWFATERTSFEREAFAPASVTHEVLSFKHWPTLPALAMMQHPARVRIVTMDVLGPRSTEGGALPILAAISGVELPVKERHAAAWVAVSAASHLPVAIAAVQPDPRFHENTDIVDLFSAPGFEAELPALFQHLPLRAGRVRICYADRRWPPKQEILKKCGFALKTFVPEIVTGEVVEIWVKYTIV